AAAAGAVGRAQSLRAFAPAVLEEVADRMGGQAEVGGDGRSRLAALGTVADDVPQGERGRRRHTRSSRGRKGSEPDPQQIALPGPAKLGGGIRGKTLCRN